MYDINNGRHWSLIRLAQLYRDNNDSENAYKVYEEYVDWIDHCRLRIANNNDDDIVGGNGNGNANDENENGKNNSDKKDKKNNDNDNSKGMIEWNGLNDHMIEALLYMSSKCLEQGDCDLSEKYAKRVFNQAAVKKARDHAKNIITQIGFVKRKSRNGRNGSMLTNNGNNNMNNSFTGDSVNDSDNSQVHGSPNSTSNSDDDDEMDLE